jgi:CheY-like chemotaxis protein
MRSATQHLPVILVLGKRKKNHDEVDEWLAGSRYSTHEAQDVFQALEQVSDFTVRDTPDVVYLHVDKMDTELAMLEHMLVSAVGEPCASVVAFSDQDSTDTGTAGFGVLKRQLDRLIPCPPQVN